MVPESIRKEADERNRILLQNSQAAKVSAGELAVSTTSLRNRRSGPIPNSRTAGTAKRVSEGFFNRDETYLFTAIYNG